MASRKVFLNVGLSRSSASPVITLMAGLIIGSVELSMSIRQAPVLWASSRAKVDLPTAGMPVIIKRSFDGCFSLAKFGLFIDVFIPPIR